jgi:hypothetical protein
MLIRRDLESLCDGISLNNFLYEKNELLNNSLSYIVSAQAQTGEIRGKITDMRTAGGIKSANVMASDSSGGHAGKIFKTDAYGNYAITALTPGTYNLQCAYKGFMTETIKGIIASADKTTFLNIQLKPAIRNGSGINCYSSYTTSILMHFEIFASRNYRRQIAEVDNRA